jgi:hypothetical protein
MERDAFPHPALLAIERSIVDSLSRMNERRAALTVIAKSTLEPTGNEIITAEGAKRTIQQIDADERSLRESLETVRVWMFEASSLEALLETWQVFAPDMWVNATGPDGWWAVTNDDGIVAYFGTEAAACRFRLVEINRALNG